jgi:peptidoglycan hydrolase-like protein with peptidoglycan-binding domain
MAFALQWLPDVLLGAGLKVAEVPGWQTRGRGEVGETRGVLCHHTAGPASGNMPSLRILVDGRRTLPGPLSHLGLGRDGTYYVIAAGRANHAGRGMWAGITSGNTHMIGIEAEHTGRREDAWPAVQMAAYERGVAAILGHLQLDAERCAGHKEYALPRGRKPDPAFDMVEFRAGVARILSGAQPAPSPIPSVEPEGRARPTLRRGSVGESVRVLQRLLGIPATGFFDVFTEYRIRELQRREELVPDGIVGPKTWLMLDRAGTLFATG